MEAWINTSMCFFHSLTMLNARLENLFFRVLIREVKLEIAWTLKTLRQHDLFKFNSETKKKEKFWTTFDTSSNYDINC